MRWEYEVEGKALGKRSRDIGDIGGRLLVGPGKKYWTIYMKIKHLRSALCLFLLLHYVLYDKF